MFLLLPNTMEIGVSNRPDEPSTLGDRHRLFIYIMISFLRTSF